MRALTQIAVGYDTSRQGLDALILGELLARTLDAELLALRVEVCSDDAERRRAEDELDADLDRVLAGSAVRRLARVLSDRSATSALGELAARERAIGLIVVGSTHRAGLGRVVPGGVAERLLGAAPCSIAVAPSGYATGSGNGALAQDLRVIGVGYDASQEAEAALGRATEIASGAKATLRVIAIGHPVAIGPKPSPAAVGSAARPAADLQSRLHEVVAALPPELRALPVYDRGAPGSLLLEHAEEGIDLLLMGSRGHAPLGAALLGTTSRAVLTGAPCPVIVVTRPALKAQP